MFRVPPLTAVGGEVDVVAVGLTVPLHAVRTNPTVAKVAMPASRLDLRDINYSFEWFASGVRKRQSGPATSWA